MSTGCSGVRLQGTSVASLQRALVQLQNPDGGWGYGSSVSWTEPTACAALALLPEERNSTAAAVAWLKSMQRPDGGWPPTAAVDCSTWVTAPATLALSRAGDLAPLRRGRDWLMAQAGRESHWVIRLRRVLLGIQSDVDTRHEGWPWYPGAAAWVVPTSLGILAMKSMARRIGPTDSSRVTEAQRFLLARACADGGWNHGSSRSLGYDAGSYPENTGIALLALKGVRAPEVEAAIGRAEQHLESGPSGVSLHWLQLGLLAHSRVPTGVSSAVPPIPRDPTETAVAILAQRALEGERDLFD